MFSSKKDLEGSLVLLLVFALLFLAPYVLGFNPQNLLVNFANSGATITILKEGIKILAIPIGVDIVIIFLARFLSGNR